LQQNLLKARTVWYRSTCLPLLIREPLSLLVFKAKLETLSVQQISRTPVVGH